jgi:hypothetical protein
MSGDDSEEEVKPPKKDTKKVSKKPSAEKKALDAAADPPAKEKTGKTKKVAKPADAPPPEAEKGEEAAEKKDDSSEKKPKSATGKIKKPGGKSDGGKARRPGPPPPPPAVRGGLDYALAVLAPLLCAGLGAYGFMLVKSAVDHCANPILTETFANPVQDIPAQFSWATAFAPAPICVGGVVGLLATLCFLKMAPGMGARLMGAGMLGFGILSTIPFIGAGQQLQAIVKSTIRKAYPIPRGGEVDARALDLKIPDYTQRHFLGLWKVEMDDGDVPVSWIAASDDPGLPTGDKVPEDEVKIKNADLRDILARGRELVAAKKMDDELWKKITAYRDAANKEIDAPSEATETLKTNWGKFEGRCKGDLAKPPEPKNAAWFAGFTPFEAILGHQGTSQDSRAFYQKLYLGKAIHKAVKELPAEMRLVGAFRAEVKEDAPVDGLAKYDFCWLCYDLEKPDRPPVMIPHYRGLWGEARFNIEVLGQK